MRAGILVALAVVVDSHFSFNSELVFLRVVFPFFSSCSALLFSARTWWKTRKQHEPVPPENKRIQHRARTHGLTSFPCCCHLAFTDFARLFPSVSCLASFPTREVETIAKKKGKHTHSHAAGCTEKERKQYNNNIWPTNARMPRPPSHLCLCVWCL